jgi:hypothetical protein
MDWRELQAAEAALTDGGPGAYTFDAMRSFLKLVRSGDTAGGLAAQPLVRR